MKKLFKLLAISAVAALSLLGCKKQEINNPSPKEKQTIQVSFSAGLPQTKTYITYDSENKKYISHWSETDNVKLVEFIDDDYFQDADSDTATIKDEVATFTAELLDMDDCGESYKYRAVYPTTTNIDYLTGDIDIAIPAEQNYTLNSFDKAADILISEVYDNKENQLSSGHAFRFARVNAVAKMTISNLALTSGEKVESVSFQATGKPLADEAILEALADVNELLWMETGSDKITVNFETPTESVSDIYFTLAPTTLKAGDAFEIVITTNLKTYTYSSTLKKELKFTASDVKGFTANFSGIEGVSKGPDYSGTYIIAVEFSGTYYSLSNVVTGSRLSKKDVTGFDKNTALFSTDDETVIWDVIKQADGSYCIKNGAKYLYHNGTKNTASLSDGIQTLNISKQADGSYRIYPSETYQLESNNSDKHFGFYSKTQKGVLYFIPAVYEPQPTLTVDVKSLTWAADETDAKTIAVTATTAEGNPAEWDYTPKEDTNFTIEKTATGLTVTPKAVNEDEVNDNICDIEITFGTLSETIVATQSKKPAGGVTKLFRKVISDQADWSGTYLIVYETGSVAFNGSLTTLDATFNTISVSISDEVIAYTEALLANTFVIASKSGGYSVKSASANYIGRTANSNGIHSSASDEYTNTISFVSKNEINIAGSSGPYLRYNSNSTQKRFRFYTSGQQAIQLYKLVEE